MKILITYQSKTGFTKKYAEWIHEELNSDIKDVKEISDKDISEYDIVIHGGWIMGGMINGLDKIRKLNPKKLIVFGVGYTSKGEVDSKKLIEVNKLGDIPLFYYQWGMNPKKMGFIGRTMVKLVTREALSYEDNTNKEEIDSLVKSVIKL